jgi:hypothetical protein
VTRKRKPTAILKYFRKFYADDGYDPEDNARKCYDLAISAMREKLESFRCERIGPHKLYLGDCRALLPLLPTVPDELERQADAIIRRGDDELLAEIRRNSETLERIQQELLQPRNDPEYLKRLEEADAARSFIANKVETVHIVPDGGKTWVGLGLTNPRHHADALEVARRLGEHFEATVISHDE